jgi:DNA-binding transcriptional MerR regulator
MSNLHTIGEVAARLSVPLHRVDYVVRTRGIQPARVGPYRVFSDQAVARIKAELERIDQRPALTPAV